LDLLQILLLALIQGVTEFLPVSSSGHLILTPALLGWADQGLAFDVAVHVGTLTAVVAYFRRDLWNMVRHAFNFGRPEAKLGWLVVLGTVPLGLAGLIFSDVVETTLRSPAVIATSTAVFGVVLWIADRLGRRDRDEHGLTWRDVLVIGCAQAIALIPGTSRSGITMTAALALGLDREAASRFSFLLAVPALSMAGLWKMFQLFQETAPVPWASLGLGVVLSAITAFVTIALFLKLIGRLGMSVFALYRLALAGVIAYVLV
jgi:undecaprenyl-diphosphatase